MAKKKLEQVQQVHGKEDKFKPSTLEQVWGDTGLSKYKTLDVNEYTAQLSTMNKSDLYAHASKVGVVPVDSREMTVKKLVAEFKRHVGSYKMPAATTKTPTVPSQKIMSILAEGR